MRTRSVVMKTTYAGPSGTVDAGRTGVFELAEARALVSGRYGVYADEDTAGEDGRQPAAVKPAVKRQTRKAKAQPEDPGGAAESAGEPSGDGDGTEDHDD